MAPEETPADLFEPSEDGFVVGVDGIETEAPAAEEAVEAVVEVVARPTEEVAPAIEVAEAPKPTAPDNASADAIAASLNTELQKIGSDLVAQASEVNKALAYVLVKSPASTYCFGRVPVESNGAKPSMELLCNIPVKAHTDIATAIKGAGIDMSSRLFFHASGML